MTDRRTAAHKISSFATPTQEDIALFESLPLEQQRELLRAEIEKGFDSGIANESFEKIIAEARAERRARNG
jgi:hypothetical protein